MFNSLNRTCVNRCIYRVEICQFHISIVITKFYNYRYSFVNTVVFLCCVNDFPCQFVLHFGIIFVSDKPKVYIVVPKHMVGSQVLQLKIGGKFETFVVLVKQNKK